MNANMELVFSEEGHVYLDQSVQAQEVVSEALQKQLAAWFSQPFPLSLLKLGLYESSLLPLSFSFWQGFVRQLLTQVCKLHDLANTTVIPMISPPDKETLAALIQQAPFIRGFEYLTADRLITLWQQLNTALAEEINQFKGSVQEYFAAHNLNWNLLGRVCFHLAENKNNPERPFAFVATYTAQVNQHTAVQHIPLKKALQEYAGEKNQTALLALLVPVQKAAEKSEFIQNLVNSGAIFQALSWDVRTAHQFLTALPLIEDSGVMVRIPNWWNRKKPPRARITVSVGEKPASMLGLDALLDFDITLSLGDGKTLSPEDWQALMSSKESLVQVKGQWVEIDRDKLKSVLKHWTTIKASAGEGISLSDGLRLLAGTQANDAEDAAFIDDRSADWSTVIAGDWLKTVLTSLRDPRVLSEKPLEKTLKTYLNATLRPYQLTGVNWLWFLYQLKLGACLADDMGLGKTIQMLAFLLLTKYHAGKTVVKPHLLVVPASLIGNWASEIARFAPGLSYRIVHGSSGEEDALLESSKAKLQAVDLVITTYTFVHRLRWLKAIEWDVIVLDEAQAIKNPGAKQTIAVKELKSSVRFVLTGTPVENCLSDLWSLFDFTFPGLLGGASAFSRYEKKLLKANSDVRRSQFMAAIRTLTQPYILRRLKSDKAIIHDLPDKTEVQSFCTLSAAQIKLYADAVQTLTAQLQELDGIQRRGVVLSYLMRFKQICNHPAQWLGYGDYAEQDSGKWMRLREICTQIAAKQEKVLVFTQFKEIIPQLSAFLATIFGKEGLSLHGETAVKKRQALVESFQAEQGPPFFILSLKAGGTGLTLTRASHVIHFDRWWNPAVENQATDRAYRIGQKHPVMVHKFICRGTIEEKIDEMIQKKKALSEEIIQSGSELSLTELSNKALLDMISLDIHRALGEV